MKPSKKRDRQFRPDTILIHSGGDPENRNGAVSEPVYRASTIVFPTVAQYEASRDPATRFDVVRYGQLGTPTTFALEEAVAAIEDGYRTALVPSGLAAVTVALQALLKSGDHLLMVDTAYAPTRHFCDTILARFGVTTTYYDPLIGRNIGSLFRPTTRVVFVESPGSITFEVQDVPAIAHAAHRAGITVVMDNSWASPYFFPAIGHGVDVSIQAASKYINGHSDVMMGTITTTQPLYDRVRSTVAELGLCVSPDDAYLTLRGMRTLGIRMERHQRNALRVATWLNEREEVARVMYPALPCDPGHAIWKRDFTGASGLFGVVLKPVPKSSVDTLLNSLALFGMGVSFGGFESLAIPMDPAPLRTATQWDGEGPCLRLHIGLEDPDDLIADLAGAFEKMHESANTTVVAAK
ncbi:MAG TPA: cystathionine beta-lyase [Gemmatimonadaceae bacterium]|nr:cystathionine beta-lyase [Gemmatimonadaceae bacterium]